MIEIVPGALRCHAAGFANVSIICVNTHSHFPGGQYGYNGWPIVKGAKRRIKVRDALGVRNRGKVAKQTRRVGVRGLDCSEHSSSLEIAHALSGRISPTKPFSVSHALINRIIARVPPPSAASFRDFIARFRLHHSTTR